MEDVEKFARAKEQMEEITALYVHIGAFVVGMVVMLIVDIMDGGDWWVIWPLLGWGAGILGHAWAVYGRIPRVIQNWQLRKIKTLKADM